MKLREVKTRICPTLAQWGDDEVRGLFLQFVTPSDSKEIIYALIELEDGTVQPTPVEAFRFVDNPSWEGQRFRRPHAVVRSPKNVRPIRRPDRGLN